MDTTGILLDLIIWAHIMAAVAWIGGSLFYALALNPAIAQVGRSAEISALLGVVGREFRRVVQISILLFLGTGSVLAFDRLSFTRIPLTYVAVLAIKIGLSLWMFWLAGRIGAPRDPDEKLSPPRLGGWLRPPYLILIVGSVVYLLSVVLNDIFIRANAAS